MNNHTVFEWIIESTKGAQNTVCGGGRYDGLVEQLGGPKKPAIGFSIGLERLLELWMATHAKTPTQEIPEIYLIKSGEKAQVEGLLLAEQLRSVLPALKLQVDCMGGHFRQQFKRADESHAPIALVVGDDEVLVVGDEGLVVVLVELAGHVVRDVEQRGGLCRSGAGGGGQDQRGQDGLESRPGIHVHVAQVVMDATYCERGPIQLKRIDSC